MSRTLLAVGPWRECGKIIASAMSHRWSVLYTLLFEDIQIALKRSRVDLVILSGRPSRAVWEKAVRDAWEVCGDTSVVALGSRTSQDALVSALVGEGFLDAAGAHGENFTAAGVGIEAQLEAGLRGCFRCSELSPTLRLFEPQADGVCTAVGRALDFIERHYAEPITLDDAARAAAYSRCHFSKLFKEQLGVCFVRYLGRVRIRRAVELLARTEMQITTVAFEVGFNDLSHFERVFRAVHRLSPSEFRAEAKKMAYGEKKTPSLSAPGVTP
jgi:AraC-like DNA-binding protein